MHACLLNLKSILNVLYVLLLFCNRKLCLIPGSAHCKKKDTKPEENLLGRFDKIFKINLGLVNMKVCIYAVSYGEYMCVSPDCRTR